MHDLSRDSSNRFKSASHLFELVCSLKFLIHTNETPSSTGVVALVLKAKLKDISSIGTLGVI